LLVAVPGIIPNLGALHFRIALVQQNFGLLFGFVALIAFIRAMAHRR
jgi:hypothetical protein